jgi:hypothetical protein
MSDHEELGPVEYVLLGFPGNQFTGEIVPAIAELVERGLVRILDIVFVTKDADGNVAGFELEDLAVFAGLADIDGDHGGLVSDEDIVLAAEGLAPESSAALIVWEDLWAAPLARAIRAANGVLLGGERIPHEIVQEALASLQGGE